MSNDNPPVLKLAQPGYDVHTAGDENLIYNSNWPLLKTYQEGSYKTDNIGVVNNIADHDLNFVPFFWYFANTPIGAWANLFTAGQDFRSEYMGPVGDGAMEIDSKSLKFQPSSGSPAVTGKSQLYYQIFALDITKQYNAPIIKVGGVRGGKPTRVFKIAKEGKVISSDDLFDFVINSRARSPLIHSVNPSPGVTKDFQIPHGLNYQPLFFGFEKTSRGTYKAMITGQGGSSSFQADDQAVKFTDTGGKELTIVILKDPFIVDYSVSVTV